MKKHRAIIESCETHTITAVMPVVGQNRSILAGLRLPTRALFPVVCVSQNHVLRGRALLGRK